MSHDLVRTQNTDANVAATFLNKYIEENKTETEERLLSNNSNVFIVILCISAKKGQTNKEPNMSGR